MTCACDRSGDGAIEASLPRIAPGLAELLLLIASRGGRPGTAVVVLTDRRNAPWFYPPGAVLPGLDRIEPPGVVELGRKLAQVEPRLRAECPACADRLLAMPSDRMPVYIRVHDPPQASLTSVPFPRELEVLARLVVAAGAAGAEARVWVDGRDVGPGKGGRRG